MIDIIKALMKFSPMFAQTSGYWGGTVTGDAGPYTDDFFSDVWRKFFTRDRTTQGVIPDYANELAVTNPAGTTIRTATGAAIVDGKFYENTANVDNAVVAPGSGSNYYTLVLDKDFVAQTVRISLLGPNAVAPPAVTQVDGTTWEIALAEIEITSGSVITITDVRDYAFNVIAPDAITTDKILDGAVTAAKLTDGAGSGIDADLLDGEEGAHYENSLSEDRPSANLALTGAGQQLTNCDLNIDDGTWLIIVEAHLRLTGSAGQWAYCHLNLVVNAVQQNGEGEFGDEIGDNATDINVTITHAWVVTNAAGVVNIHPTAYKEAGSTATATIMWQTSNMIALKVSD